MIKPREKTPKLEVQLINGTNWVLKEQTPQNFTMVIFYRGYHCPICKKYLEKLQTLLDEYSKRGVNVVAISSDNKERAQNSYDNWEIPDVPLGYGYDTDQARDWGLFISTGIKDEPTKFIEPGLFLIKSDGTLYCESIQSMPFARPDLEDFLKSIDYILEEDYPARGEA